ncbi:hypothetical protein GCK72_008029 [Caenorhabditis remanei]|uniref:F-box associated domain-containing protein n=1 Tax=Caenorhabditis remanei TaxID=31234 RepID=A0A6A5HJL2_CAERE|nr:hypothetical protein GCK72_008029 [Caenorhabditis remanei]KAF1768068.1 hypothetical protein GCK72_008029 [Caenorhabditis remanei]
MPTALGYPGLQCVLEFLDPMRRIHIVSRAHSLRTIDKIIPLSIEELGINGNCLNLKYYEIDNCTDNELRFKNGRWKDFRRIRPSNLKTEEAMKKLLVSYLKAGSKIYVKCLVIFSAIPEFVPPNLILQINELRCCFHYIEQFLPIIDQSCFPLKKLRITISEPYYLNHPVLTSAQELIVLHGFDGVPKIINQNTNKRVTFETYCFRTEDPVVLIRNWMKRGKGIGTTFKFHDYEDNRVMHFLVQKLKEFKTESNHHNQVTPILRVPIEPFAEIRVSKDNENYIVVEVVPITLKRETDATEEPCSSKKAKQ